MHHCVPTQPSTLTASLSASLQSDRITIANVTLDVSEPRNGPPEGALGIRLSGDGHWGVRVGEARASAGGGV